ncbi:MAG: Abi-alpha family protein [Alphaproteobacteria bacterium]
MGWFAPLVGKIVNHPKDWFAAHQSENLRSIFGQAGQIHRDRGIEPEDAVPIPPRIGIPLLEQASAESEPALQEMWAGLIANAADPNRRIDLMKAFIAILGQMDPLEARLVNFVSSQGWRGVIGPHDFGFMMRDLVQQLGASEDDVRLALNSLARNNLVAGVTPTDLENIEESVQRGALWWSHPKVKVVATTLGMALVEACRV